jgi:hypothetical protein
MTLHSDGVAPGTPARPDKFHHVTQQWPEDAREPAGLVYLRTCRTQWPER